MEKTNFTLDSLIIALQKSISRVNRDTAKATENDTNAAFASLSGNIVFELKCKCEMDESDKIILSEKGSIEINLSGQIDPDIGVEIKGAENARKTV